jgi:hypothetical protein
VPTRSAALQYKNYKNGTSIATQLAIIIVASTPHTILTQSFLFFSDITPPKVTFSDFFSKHLFLGIFL